MPTNLTEFTDDTAFEMYILERATPLLPRSQGTSVIELGDADSFGVIVGAPPATIRVSAGDSTSSPMEQLSADDIRPLLFGAAWKVLDQLCELALEEAQVPHNTGSRYLINFKAAEAANGVVVPTQPLDRHPDLWSRIMKIYATTKELRHSLVHRRLIVDPATGRISGVASPGQPAPAPTPVTADEQSAFCQVAVGAAEAVINRTLPTRRADQLAWALDQLTTHHGQPSLGVSPARGVIPRVVVQASPGPSNDISLDFTRVGSLARVAVQGVSHYDIEIRLPDGRALAGAMEDAPAGQTTFSLANPPSWLRWI